MSFNIQRPPYSLRGYPWKFFKPLLAQKSQVCLMDIPDGFKDVTDVLWMSYGCVTDIIYRYQL